MNKYIAGVSLSFLFALSLFAFSETANATVGGPTYISNFQYNPKDESVYYKIYNQGGRGCPPELLKISLVNSEVQKVYSCDQGEKIMDAHANNYAAGLAMVSSEIHKITSDFKDLSPISLRKNNINFELKLHNEVKMEGDSNFILNRIFDTAILKDGNKVLETKISGCNAEQPFTFAGYAIPGFNKKIIILSSAKGNCMEGGYTNESLIVVGDLDNINKEPINFYKDNSALVPNEGTMTVIPLQNSDDSGISNNATSETSQLDKESSTTTSSSSSSKMTNELSNNISQNKYIIILLSLTVLILLGIFIGKSLRK